MNRMNNAPRILSQIQLWFGKQGTAVKAALFLLAGIFIYLAGYSVGEFLYYLTNKADILTH